MNKRSILICTHTYPPDRGGIAAFSRDLKYLFENMNWKATLHFRRPSGEGVLRRFFKNGKEMFRACLLNKYDVLLATRILPYGLMGFIFRKYFGYKLIIQVHGTEITGRFTSGYRHKVLRYMYNRTDQIWANSNNTKERLISYGVREDRIVVVHPFLTDDISKVSIQSSRERGKVLRIFTAANLYPRKGIDLVLQALSKLKHLSWEYVIAGSAVNGYEGIYEEMAEQLDLTSRVKFLGQLKREDVWKELANSDLFVLVSREMKSDIESFGIVYMEAQYFGLPCIGTDTGGVPEAIGDGGLLIESENIVQLYNYLKNLITQEHLRETMAENCKKRIAAAFLISVRTTEVIKHLSKIGVQG